MTENAAVGALVKRMRALPGAVVFKHADAYTASVPDISITWKGKTVWLEAKYIKAPSRALHKRGSQHKTMVDLHRAASNAFYVIFDEHQGGRVRTYVCAPDDLEIAVASHGELACQMTEGPHFDYALPWTALFLQVKLMEGTHGTVSPVD